MKKCFALFFILSLFLNSCGGDNDDPEPEFWEGYSFAEEHFQDYGRAGEIIRDFFREKNFKEVYCGCVIEDGKKFDKSSCGYSSKFATSNQNTRELQHEHVVPASLFGSHFPEWQKEYQPGCGDARACASKHNAVYKKMESDMWNLLPAIGELNQLRGAPPPGEILGEKKEFGDCDFEYNSEVSEPRPPIRGDVARIYFYMDYRYPGLQIVNDSNRELFRKWAEKDPVSRQEKALADLIAQYQGYGNPFVSEGRAP